MRQRQRGHPGGSKGVGVEEKKDGEARNNGVGRDGASGRGGDFVAYTCGRGRLGHLLLQLSESIKIMLHRHKIATSDASVQFLFDTVDEFLIDIHGIASFLYGPVEVDNLCNPALIHHDVAVPEVAMNEALSMELLDMLAQIFERRRIDIFSFQLIPLLPLHLLHDDHEHVPEHSTTTVQRRCTLSVRKELVRVLAVTLDELDHNLRAARFVFSDLLRDVDPVQEPHLFGRLIVAIDTRELAFPISLQIRLELQSSTPIRIYEGRLKPVTQRHARFDWVKRRLRKSHLQFILRWILFRQARVIGFELRRACLESRRDALEAIE